VGKKFDAMAYLADFNKKERLRAIHDEMAAIEKMARAILKSVDDLRAKVKEELGDRPADPPEVDNGDPFGS